MFVYYILYVLNVSVLLKILKSILFVYSLLIFCFLFFVVFFFFFFFFKQKTAYEMRISDWSSDVCSSDLVLSPPLWAWAITRSNRPGYVLVAGCMVALLAFAGFTLTHSVLSLIVVMAIFGLFFNAVMPQFEAMTLTALGRNANDYGRIRLWGSIGFLLVAGSYGALLDRLGDASFPWLSLPLLAATVWAASLLRNDPEIGRAHV